MQTAGARALREDDQDDMSREAVLLQWERKIEAEERRPTRFGRTGEEGAEAGESGTVAELRPNEDATHEVPRRFERRAAELLTEQPLAERRPQARAVGHEQPHGPARAAWPLGLPARPLPDGRGRRHGARLAGSPRAQ